MTPQVSIIVLTKNSQEFLMEALNDLQEQTFQDTEIIVVDNFSTDHTEMIARQFADQFYKIGPERVAQANCGINKAKGEYIYLTGSDLTRDKDFISQCVSKMIYFDAVRMSVLTDKRVKHYWGRVKALERETYIGTFIESARFFKKSVWEKLGRFDEDLIAMEEDFQHRLDKSGYKSTWIDAREYHLHENESLWKTFKQFYYYGKYTRKYLKKHKDRGFKQLNPARPNLKLFLKQPKLLMGFIVYKLVQYTGGILGMLRG